MTKPIPKSDSELNEIWNVGFGDKGEGVNFLRTIVPHISKYMVANECSGSLLDIGCGGGNLSAILNNIGFEVTAIDTDEKLIDKAKAQYSNIDFSSFTFKETLPYEDNTFDVIFSSSVLQYLERKPILNECKRVLKKDGSLILIENLKNNPITRSGRAYLKFKKHKYHAYPWNHFTLSEIENLTNEFDNSSVKVFHFSSPIVYLNFLQKLFPFLIRIDKNLLRIKFFKRFAWLALFTGKNK